VVEHGRSRSGLRRADHGLGVAAVLLSRSTPIEQVTVPQIIQRLEGLVGALATPPILIGTRREKVADHALDWALAHARM
jgi:hypothetical protein